jgi:hypothetical protein
VAYKLKLPETSAVHPVFHVSQLKKAPGTGHHISTELPQSALQLQVPLPILNRRMVTRGTSEVLQVLVQWTGLSPSLATWEDAAALKQRFPGAPAWGQAGSQDRRSVTSPGPRPLDDRSRRSLRPNPRVAGPEWVQ